MTSETSRRDVPARSSYIDYLPALYRDDELMGRFLLIFESVLKPLEHTVDNLDLFFDPLLTPEVTLPWLASWLDLAFDPSWPVRKRRDLIKAGAELYRWRGTKRGLSEYLRIYTGTVPEIVEYIPGMTLDGETQLGMGTKLGSSGAGLHFTVILNLDDKNTADEGTVRHIIESQKPAHAGYILEIRRRAE